MARQPATAVRRAGTLRTVSWLPALLMSLLLAMPAHATGEVAPAWTLKTPAGETVRYPQDAQGQPTVLLFWPSWCPYSRALQPYVQDIWRDYRDLGVRVWTINIKETGDPLQAMRERDLSFPLLLHGDALVRSYGITRTPWFLVIDGAQRIVYTRPADAPTPPDVARAAREALNALLGDRAVPLPASYPPPYDLHLRTPPPARRAEDAADNAEWLPWADAYLAAVGIDERVDWVTPRGALADGKAAIAAAREVWAEAFGAGLAREQAPFRAYRRNDLWLVVGRAWAGHLGEGALLVIHAEDGRVLQLQAPGP
jgi:peroxiredoxin